jgi:hypothetical protein
MDRFGLNGVRFRCFSTRSHLLRARCASHQMRHAARELRRKRGTQRNRHAAHGVAGRVLPHGDDVRKRQRRARQHLRLSTTNSPPPHTKSVMAASITLTLRGSGHPLVRSLHCWRASPPRRGHRQLSQGKAAPHQSELPLLHTHTHQPLSVSSSCSQASTCCAANRCRASASAPPSAAAKNVPCICTRPSELLSVTQPALSVTQRALASS